jgi:hypothetical protein
MWATRRTGTGFQGRNSSSLTFVLTLLMRSGGFSKHRLARTLNWILRDGRTKPVRRREGQQGAGRGLRD